MLEDLQILNGSITPRFDSNILQYDVEVDSTVFSLDLNYKISDDTSVTVYGNDYLTSGEGHVLLEVYNGTLTTYQLNVYKKSVDVLSHQDSSSVDVSIKNAVINDIRDPLIGVICFLLIVFLYIIIFGKHKKKCK